MDRIRAQRSGLPTELSEREASAAVGGASSHFNGRLLSAQDPASESSGAPLIAFEPGDTHPPVVLGGLWSGKDTPPS